MAFIPEDGTGLANANSIIDVAFADSYFLDRGNSVWSGLTTDAKQTALIKATDYLENKYAYKGSVLKTTQALEFPRTGLFIRGESFEGTPEAIKQACAELGVRASQNDLSPDPKYPTSEGSLKEKRVKAGPVETEKKYYENPVFLKQPTFVKIDDILFRSGILSHTTWMNGGVIRG